MRARSTVILLAFFLTACIDHSDGPETLRQSDGGALAEASLASTENPPSGDFEQVGSNPVRDVYFGNLHVHTRWSFDAFANGAASGPDEAYRWARGEQIPGGGGYRR